MCAPPPRATSLRYSEPLCTATARHFSPAHPRQYIGLGHNSGAASFRIQEVLQALCENYRQGARAKTSYEQCLRAQATKEPVQRTAAEVPVASTKSTGFSVKTAAEAGARTVKKQEMESIDGE